MQLRGEKVSSQSDLFLPLLAGRETTKTHLASLDFFFFLPVAICNTLYDFEILDNFNI